MTKLINKFIKFFLQSRISRLEAYVNSQTPSSTADVERAGKEFFQRNDNYTWGL